MTNQVSLFLGLAIDQELTQDLSKLSSELKGIYIAPDSEHLQKVSFQGKEYLGKSAGEHSDLNTIELVASHIISVLKKLTSKQITLSDLVLLPLNQSNL